MVGAGMAGGLTLKTSLNGSNFDMERRPKNRRLLEKADYLLISLVHRFNNKSCMDSHLYSCLTGREHGSETFFVYLERDPANIPRRGFNK